MVPKSFKLFLEESENLIQKMAKEANLNIKKYDLEQIQKGLKVEKEHMKSKDINVIKKPSDVLKIVIAHLREDDKYYDKLENVEKKFKKP